MVFHSFIKFSMKFDYDTERSDTYNAYCLFRAISGTEMNTRTSSVDPQNKEAHQTVHSSWSSTITITAFDENYNKPTEAYQLQFGTDVFFEILWQPEFHTNFPITLSIGKFYFCHY